MAKKFDIGRATAEELRERVTKLTSALIKQISRLVHELCVRWIRYMWVDTLTITRMHNDVLCARVVVRASVQNNSFGLAEGPNRQDQKVRAFACRGEREAGETGIQVNNYKEEAEISRQMRSELQGEVARMQRALELRAAEAELVKTEAQKYIFGSDTSPNSDEELRVARDEISRLKREACFRSPSLLLLTAGCRQLEDARTKMFLTNGEYPPTDASEEQEDSSPETHGGLVVPEVEPLRLCSAAVALKLWPRMASCLLLTARREAMRTWERAGRTKMR
eukprot:766527-Hanusia_phi.AAC.9